MKRLPFGLSLLSILLICGLVIAGCDRTAEVSEEALTEGEPITEADTDGGEVEVYEAGPAAWTCDRYLEISADSGENQDPAEASEAEEFVGELVLAALADSGAEVPDDDEGFQTRLREELTQDCSRNPEWLLSDAASELVTTWDTEDED